MSVTLEFANFIESCGGVLKGIPNMDGVSHRIPSVSDDKNKTSMAYRGYLDGVPNGWVQDFKTGEKHTWKFSEGATGLSADEIKELDRQIAENAKRKAEAEADKLAKSQELAYAVKNSCIPAHSHPYLKTKKVKAYGILQATKKTEAIYPAAKNGDLILPLYNPSFPKRLVSFQIIQADGSKYLAKDSIVKGSFGVIGKVNKNSPIIICEGFATAATLHNVTNRAVVVAINASNLGAAYEHFKSFDVVVAADNDRHLPLKPVEDGRNPLKNIGMEYASSLGVPVLCPKDEDNGGIDWNDYYVKYGKKQTINAIESQNMSVIPSKQNTKIMLEEGHDDENAEAIERALIAAGSPFYVCGHNLVMPTFQASVDKSSSKTGMYLVNSNTINMEVSKHITLVRMKKVPRKDEWVEVEVGISLDLRVLIIERAATFRSLFPRLKAVTSSPTLKPSGHVLHEDGYDEETQIYHYKNPSIKLKSLPKTKEQALKSIKKIEGLLSEFPFEGPADLAVALSAILACSCRGALHNIPLYAINASTMGSGKTYLIETINHLAFGSKPATITHTTNPEEMEKRLGGFLLSGKSAINLDNCNGILGGDLLCQILTSDDLDVRRLGSSDLINVSTTSIFFATGNGLQLEGDLGRRSMICVLNSGEERPELRDFKSDPYREVEKNRSEYLTASFNVILSYMASGVKSDFKNLASFEIWSSLICGALVWLGYSNPMESINRVRDEDPEIADLRIVIEICKHVKDGLLGGFGAGEMISYLTQVPEVGAFGTMDSDVDYQQIKEDRMLLASIVGENGRVNVRRLGRYLMHNKDRILDGHRISRCGTLSGGRPKWTVEEVKKI